MESINKINYIQSIFGINYTDIRNISVLKDNYNSILSSKDNLLSKIKFFIDNSTPTTQLSLSILDLDLLLFNNSSKQTVSSINQLYDNYFNYQELKLFEILKKIALSTSQLTEEDYLILNSFFRNRSRIERMLSTSGNGKLSIDKTSLEVLLDLVSKRKLTVGHTIRIYENICEVLNIGNYLSSSKLDYNINI